MSKNNLNGNMLMSAYYGDVIKLRRQIDSGADVNSATKLGVTALNIAVEKLHYECVELLLDCGADVNKKDNKGCAPLHWAVMHASVKFIKMLVGPGVDIHALDTNCKVLDVRMYENWQKEIFIQNMKYILLKLGFDTNQENINNEISQYLHMQEECDECVELLLGKDAE